MSTQSQSELMASLTGKVAPLAHALHVIRRQALVVWVVTTILITLAIAAGGLILALGLDTWLVLPSFVRLLLLLIIIAAPLAVLVNRLRRRPADGEQELALMVERQFPGLDNLLINSLQLASRATPQGAPIIEALALEANEAVDRLSLGSAVPKRSLMISATVTLGCAAVLTLSALASPAALRTGIQRVLVPFSSQTLTRIEHISPGDVDVLAMSDAAITATLSGRIPTEARLVVSNGQASSTVVTMRAASAEAPDKLTAKIERIERDTTYHIEAGDATSHDFTLRVRQRPAIQKITHRITPPAYTGAAPLDQSGGAIQALRGSKVELTIVTADPLRDGAITLGDKRLIPLVLASGQSVQDGSTASPAVYFARATLDVDRSDFYLIELTSRFGFASEPVGYDIVALEDQSPRVEIIKPDQDLTVELDAKIPVLIRATDDFAVREVRLVKLSSSGEGSPPRESASSDSQKSVTLQSWPQTQPGNGTVQGATIFSVVDAGLTSTEPIVIQAQAIDYRPDAPPGVSPPVTIRLKARADEKAASAYKRLSLEAIIAKQRANLEMTEVLWRSNGGRKPVPADLLSKLTVTQEEIRRDAIALAGPFALGGAATQPAANPDAQAPAPAPGGAANPELQKRLANLAQTLMLVAIEQLRGAATDRNWVDMVQRAAGTESAILKLLIADEARQDQALADQRQREIAQLLAELIGKQQTLRKDTADKSIETGKALSARQTMLSRESAKVARLMQAEGGSGAGGNVELASQYDRAAKQFEEKVIRSNMVVAAENLAQDARPEAGKKQDQVIADLLAIQALFRNQALAEANKDVDETKSGLSEAKKKVDKLAALQQAITEQAKALEKNKDLRDNKAELLDKIQDYKDAKKNLADAVEQLVKDLHLLPDMSASNDLLSEAAEIFEDVKQEAGSADAKAEEIAVDRDEGTLAALKAMQKKMGERIGDLEMWLMPKPDAVAWKQESWDKHEIGKIPLGDLPDELEDIIGKMLEKSEKLQKDAQDSASNVGMPDAVMGWDIADGPMPSWAAKGKSGNDKPNDMEQVGRSGSGRQGKSSGEIVGDTVKALKGAEVEARRTNDGFQGGELKEEKGDAMDVKATGGGKLAGVSGSEGMTGDAPARNELKYRNLARQHQQLKRDAETVYSKARLLKLPTGELDRAVLELDAAERRLRGGDVDGFMQSQNAVVRAIKETQAKLTGQQIVETSLTPGRASGPTQGATGEPVPKQYEDAVAEYMRKIAQP